MGQFYVDCEVTNISHPKKSAKISHLLVDTGSEYTWLPEDVLKLIGIKVEKKDVPFLMANGKTITRRVGFAILVVESFRTVDEVVFAEPGDLRLLGSRTMEGFGAMVDPRQKRLVAAGPYPAAASKKTRRMLFASAEETTEQREWIKKFGRDLVIASKK
jgi:predicted aspartyl protease